MMIPGHWMISYLARTRTPAYGDVLIRWWLWKYKILWRKEKKCCRFEISNVTCLIYHRLNRTLIARGGKFFTWPQLKWEKPSVQLVYRKSLTAESQLIIYCPRNWIVKTERDFRMVYAVCQNKTRICHSLLMSRLVVETQKRTRRQNQRHMAQQNIVPMTR